MEGDSDPPAASAVYQAERDGVGEQSIAQCRLNARERLGNGEAMQIHFDRGGRRTASGRRSGFQLGVASPGPATRAVCQCDLTPRHLRRATVNLDEHASAIPHFAHDAPAERRLHEVSLLHRRYSHAVPAWPHGYTGHGHATPIRPPSRCLALVHGSRPLGEPRSTSWPSWRQQVHDLDMKSRVHPKYKTKYHVGNWPAYDRALVQRGDITVWLAPDAIATWEAVGVGKRGGQRQYSDLAIEIALTLRLIFHLPLRQTEGFLTSIFGMLGLELSTPDHTTLSRRGQHLDLTLRRAPAGAGLHLMVDSAGLSIVGEGEWAAAKHGGRGRRGWKKRHLGVDRSGVIVARALTEASVDDATTGITLIEAVDGALGRVTADTAYDTVGFYEAAGARGATVVVPPTSTANVSRRGPRSRARDRTILAVKEIGRQRWKKMSGYHGQARVENAFFRYKSIIGDSLRACSPAGRGTEVDLACNILNQMTGLGRPMSHRIGR